MSDVSAYLSKAKTDFETLDQQLEEITSKREIALVRLQTLEMVAGEDISHTPAYAPVRRPTNQNKVTSQGKGVPQDRAPAGSWKAAIANMIAGGLKQFSYGDVMQAAKDLAIDAPMPSVRVRVSKFKAQGLLERVQDGVYKPTKKGMDFFQL